MSVQKTHQGKPLTDEQIGQLTIGERKKLIQQFEQQRDIVQNIQNSPAQEAAAQYIKDHRKEYITARAFNNLGLASEQEREAQWNKAARNHHNAALLTEITKCVVPGIILGGLMQSANPDSPFGILAAGVSMSIAILRSMRKEDAFDALPIYTQKQILKGPS